MSVKRSDWLYLGAGLVSTWYLTKMQNGSNPTLDMLRSLHIAVRRAQVMLMRLDDKIRAGIDRELDTWV